MQNDITDWAVGIAKVLFCVALLFLAILLGTSRNNNHRR